MDFERLRVILPKDPIKWTFDDVTSWLQFIGLAKYNEAFQKQSIDGACLGNISDIDLQQTLGIESSIIRKKILNWLQVGLKQYSLYLKRNAPVSNQEPDQIALSDSPFNIFKKQSLENDFIINMENTNINKRNPGLKENIHEQNDHDNLCTMSTSNIRVSEFNQLNSKNYKPLENNVNILNLKSKLISCDQNSEKKGNVLQKKFTMEEELENNTKNIANNQQTQVQQQQITQEPILYKYEDRALNEEQLQQQQQQQFQEEDQEITNSNYNIDSQEIENEEEHKFQDIQSQEQGDFPTNRSKENNKSQTQGLQSGSMEEFQEGKGNELIISYLEGHQNSFYCITEKGGRVGRHSNNEVLIYEESISRYHAEIAFRDNEFYLTDVGSTTGTFIKVQEQLLLQPGLIIEMGSNQFQVKSVTPVLEKVGTLVLSVIEGPNVKEEKVLQFSEKQNPFSIGRKQNNELSYPDDQHLSNIHARIYFIDQQFILEDLSSTNGSWIRLSFEQKKSEPYLLKDKSVIKFGTTTTFICKRNKQDTKQQQDCMFCMICKKKDRDTLFIPCKHNSTCMDCSKNLSVCPVCKVKIDESIKIFKA